MVELFWLLLPVAAFSGWFIARRGQGGGARPGRQEPLRGDYFQGLNYLLNEQPDKAIEVFTRMVEVDSDTVETHLALGNLFRRRGEVDRAIRIHQNLIARPSLNREQRTQALLELGEDYLRAGLLDRAENLFQEVVETGNFVPQALQHLLDIYQQEKEWDNAILVAARLESNSEQSMAPRVAQFYCEQVDRAWREGEVNRARSLIKRALTADPGCVRASILQGDIERSVGNYKQALKCYQRVREQDRDYLPEVLVGLHESYTQLGRPDGYRAFLEDVSRDYRGASVILALAERIRHDHGEDAAAGFLVDQLRARPSVRGLNRLIELNLSRAEQAGGADLEVLRELFHALLRDKPGYSCRNCGFSARTLHWQCPSCRKWATIKPIQGVEGE
ncbi:lipopolysaccharide assembly protein LapB [Aquisalimonas sp. APHAB1-3]|uniref:lipopolysaccharide assembly protein LapB n=1 Tax=unclassified Aquisalimonas TaxID=2644645 RepID=UPI0025C33262|nr:lipopolysaccharide assembly protein LapB [Aquisalimonas sp.]